MSATLRMLLAASILAAPIHASAAAPAPAVAPAEGQRWTAAQANEWYARQPWLTGANFIPADAINELEMWQAATFDPAEIDRELGWAQREYGMNTMRVFLHDLAWKQDPEGFKRRIDQFLAIAARHNIKPVFVLFDSCWDPDPKTGPQHPPIPGVHNSGWLRSPGRAALLDRGEEPRLRAYVEGVVGAFASDPRVLAWDVWNEPDNLAGGDYGGAQRSPEEARVEELLPKVFAWARGRHPIQPLTSGVWKGDDWSPGAKLNAIQRVQLGQSDVISFHDYGWPEQFEARVKQLKLWGRPILCTEWMARGAGSTVDTVLPVGRRENVGMINWGFVQGKIQTWLPWDSWDRPYTLKPPTIWFHDLVKPDGTPYRAREAEIFRNLRASGAARQ
jgi:hypothetical protein